MLIKPLHQLDELIDLCDTLARIILHLQCMSTTIDIRLLKYPLDSTEQLTFSQLVQNTSFSKFVDKNEPRSLAILRTHLHLAAYTSADKQGPIL